MTDGLLDKVYNPDVLSCLANLSNDEVFTPPEIVNQMLDMLPQELFRDPDATFLDPACKTGVFLREIAKRLIRGLEPQIPDLQARVDHIFKKQLFGIAITELTSLLSRRGLYCSKYPDSEFSVTRFDDAQGNIRFKRINHVWNENKCVYCGASKSQYERGEELETHAYEWIHTVKPEEIWNMKFDVIISNPPYQLSDGSGLGAGAIPIYDRFVNHAKKLSPRFISMIIPARWFAGGRGLDEFRAQMIGDHHIRVLHDFLNASDCFAGVEIKGGICYFLWDRDHPGKCKIYTHNGSDIDEQEERFLQEENSDVFIRYAEGVSIYHKVRAKNEKTMDELVSSQRPFGLRTYVHGKSEPFLNSLPLYERGGIGYVSKAEIMQRREWIDMPKVFISAAYNAGDTYPHQIIGKPIVGDKGSVCTETYVVIGPFETIEMAKNVSTYIQTKFFRFLVMLKKTSQHAPSTAYSFVPIQDFSQSWNDEKLYAKYNISEREIAFIDSMIRPMDLGGVDDAD